jgi:FkbM family methyltransferase
VNRLQAWLVQHLPAALVAWVEGRLAGRGFRSGPGLALVQALRARRQRGTVVVRRGPAAGLRLHAGDASVAIALGTHERAVQDALVRHLEAGAVFFDVGANRGALTLLGGRLVGEGGTVVALEPLPENATALRANVALNLLENVRVVEAAAGAVDGTARLYRAADHSAASLMQPTADAIDVAVVALDDAIDRAELPAPDVLKIDVEGAELDVLRGLERQLRARHPVVICELHGTKDAFERYMTGLGYRVAFITEDGRSEDNLHAIATPA